MLAETGIGKVNAAMTTTLVIEHYAPAEIIFSGIAGGLSDRVKPGDIVIGEKVGQHDFGLVSDAGMRVDELVSPTDGSPSEYASLTDTSVGADVLDTLATWLRARLSRPSSPGQGRRRCRR